MPEWMLMLAEMRRYRSVALGLALLNFAGLVYLGRLTDMTQPNIGLLGVIGAVYVVMGQLLGAWQMWNHRRANVWLNLLHRPVSPRRLMLSLAGAAALLLAAVVMLPVALALPAASLSGGLVESWQLGLALQAWLLALAGYLSAAMLLLAPGRWALLLLASPFLLAVEFLAMPWLPWPMLALVLWLLAGLDRLFKPDLASPPRGAAWVLLLGLPMVLIITVLMQIGAALGTQAVLAAAGRHPQFEQHPPADGYESLRRLNPREQLAESLGQAEGRKIDPAVWKSLQVASLVPEFDRMPVRFQPGGSESLSWRWAERGWRMVFSHTQQVYLAFDSNGRQAARLGRQGLLASSGPVPPEQRFALPPLPLESWLALGPELLRTEPGGSRLQTLLALPAAQDRFIAKPVVLGPAQDLLVLSNRELLLLDRQGAPRWRQPLPHGSRDLRSISVARDSEGWLVLMLEGRPLEPSRPWQTLLRVDESGQGRTLLSRALQPSFGDAYCWIYWAVSPLQHELIVALDAAVSKRQGGVEMDGPPLAPTAAIQSTAYALLAMSAAMAAGLARRRRLGLGAALAWVLACGLIGLPALVVAVLLMRPGRARTLSRHQASSRGLCPEPNAARGMPLM